CRVTFMAEAHQTRVQKVVEEMVQSLERDHIRNMQVRTHVQMQRRLLRPCHTPLAQAQGLVTSELEKFQDRLTRCTMHCNDKAKDLFDSGSKEPAVRSLMDRCVGSCVDDHINLVPSMTRRLKENLDSIPSRNRRTKHQRDKTTGR
uniref:Protein FAM136A n=1 Tax=Poecilia latipinna TaxID=48699 RepID=A0A3B3V0D5_9TELE